MNLIGLCGKAQCGKDTVANIYGENADYVRVALADPLKRAAQILFGLSNTWMEDGRKEQRHPYWGLSPRRMFQLLGTDAMRDTFGQDFWLRRAELTIDDLLTEGINNIVITDIRFDNEAHFVKSRGGKIIRIVRSQHELDLVGDASTHASEAGISDHLVDWTLRNDRSLGELSEGALQLLDTIELGLPV